jgi:hypothetical protein
MKFDYIKERISSIFEGVFSSAVDEDVNQSGL